MAGNNSKDKHPGKRSREFFEELWKKLILPEIEKYTKNDDVYCKSLEEAEEDIWTAYRAFNTHSSENYMVDADKPIDRHKTAACYVYAVLAAQPLQPNMNKKLGMQALFANETLAITVGCTVLSSFLSTLIEGLEPRGNESKEAFKQEQECTREKLKAGIVFPANVGHGGSYFTDVSRALRYVHIESHYSVLLFALLLFDWEERTIGPEMQLRIFESITKLGSEGPHASSAQTT